MNAVKLIIGLIPWFLFSVLVGWLGEDAVALAAGLSCLAAVGLALYDRVRGRGVKVLDYAGIATFGIMAVIGFVGGAGVDRWLSAFGRGGATFVLAAVMAISALTVPFTEQYARETVDPRYWGHPVFRAANRTISLMWAGAVATMGLAHVLSGAVDGWGTGAMNVVLNWVAPIVLIVLAVRQTKRIAGRARTLVRPS